MAQALRKVEAEAPARAPERQALAEKIARVTAARERLGRIRAGLDDNQPYKAIAAVDRAEEAVKRARDLEPQLETARILGEAAPEGPSIEEAHRALDEATKNYDRVSQIFKSLQASEADAVRDLEFAEIGVRNAVAAVVQAEPAVAALLKRYQAALREAARLRLTLQSFARFFPRELQHWDTHTEFRDVSADATWSTWVAALEHDADAPAPVLQ